MSVRSSNPGIGSQADGSKISETTGRRISGPGSEEVRQLLDPLAGDGAREQHPEAVILGRRGERPSHLSGAGTVGLVDDDQVGDLEDPRLVGLDLVAPRGGE